MFENILLLKILKFSNQKEKKPVPKWLMPKILNRMKEIEMSMEELVQETGYSIQRINSLFLGEDEFTRWPVIVFASVLNVGWHFFYEEHCME